MPPNPATEIPERQATLDDMLGHEEVRAYLKRVVPSEELPQALLVSGPSGAGKTTLAWALAKEIVSGGASAGESRAAAKVRRGTHPDVIDCTGSGTASGQITVAWIREELEPKLHRAPLESPKKVVILSPAERLNTHSANLLLKVLEEPPKDLQIIMLTADPSGVLPTIRSRCTSLPLEGVPVEKLIPWLVQRTGTARDQAELAARLAEGRPGLALSLLQGSGLGRRKSILDEIDKLREHGFMAVFGVADRMAEIDTNIPATLGTAVMILRDMLALALGGRGVINFDIEQELRAVAAKVSPEGALEAAALFERAAADVSDIYSAPARQHFMETLMIAVGRELRRN